MRVIMVSGTVLLTIFSALIVDYAADSSKPLVVVALLLAVSFMINIAKFVLWGAIHKRFYLSRSYLLSALFFPLIYIISLFKEEAVVSPQKVCGLAIILFGIMLTEHQKQ